MPNTNKDIIVSIYLNGALCSAIADALSYVRSRACAQTPPQIDESAKETFCERVLALIESTIGLNIKPVNATSNTIKLALSAPLGDTLLLADLAPKEGEALPTINSGEYVVIAAKNETATKLLPTIASYTPDAFSGLECVAVGVKDSAETLYIALTGENKLVTINDIANATYAQSIVLTTAEMSVEDNTGKETPQANALTPVSIYPGHLSSMHIDHSFVTKALQGIEYIAYNPQSEGVYTLLPKTKNSPYSKVEFMAIQAQCQRFLENKEANYLYAIKVGTTIYRLLQQPEAISCVQQGRVWLSVSTIIKGMTQTKEGHNSKAHRNETTRKKVNDAISMLATGQIVAYDKKGDKSFSSYILVANYCAEITDKAGNKIKDVWGFPCDMTGLFEYTEDMTRNFELLEHPAFRDNEIWMSQYIGNIISELRNALYPSKGKGAKTHMLKRNWDEIYQLADPSTKTSPRPKVKERIAKDLETMLESFAKQEAHLLDKQMFISANTEYDRSRGAGKGKRSTLVILGTAEPTTQIIDI